MTLNEEHQGKTGELGQEKQYLPKGTALLGRRSNYELLTATTLIYAIGAGITAAAGTRLALQ